MECLSAWAQTRVEFNGLQTHSEGLTTDCRAVTWQSQEWIMRSTIPVSLVTVLLPPVICFFPLTSYFFFSSRAKSRLSWRGKQHWMQLLGRESLHIELVTHVLQTFICTKSSKVSLWIFLLHHFLLKIWIPPLPPTAHCTFPAEGACTLVPDFQ